MVPRSITGSFGRSAIISHILFLFVTMLIGNYDPWPDIIRFGGYLFHNLLFKADCRSLKARMVCQIPVVKPASITDPVSVPVKSRSRKNYKRLLLWVFFKGRALRSRFLDSKTSLFKIFPCPDQKKLHCLSFHTGTIDSLSRLPGLFHQKSSLCFRPEMAVN